MNKNIAELRKTTGISQTEAANSLGVTNRYLNMIEKGKRNPSDELKEKMSKLYKVHISDIFLACKRTKCSNKITKNNQITLN